MLALNAHYYFRRGQARPTRVALAILTSFLLVVASLLLLGGCGNLSAADTGSGAAGNSGQTRTVLDINDEPVEVPASPKRVVTLSEPTLDGALALGVIPVGTTSGRGQAGVPSYLSDLGADIPLVGGVANPNYEEIAKVSPDIILVDGTSINNNAEVIAILREIAPVVVTGYAGGHWQINFRIVADALNLKDEGEQVIANYEQRASESAAKLSAYAGSTFSIVRWQGTSASMILNELPPGQVLLDLGLTRPENQNRDGRGHSEPVSLENLAEIDADYMFFGTLGGSSVGNHQAGGRADLEGARSALIEAVKVPGFTSLVAYQQSHIILVDGSLWTSTGGPLLMGRIIDAVEEALL